jgi:Na+/proline symporter
MTIASIGLGLIAMSHTSPETIAALVPDGWGSLWFGWKLDLDWTGRVDFANSRIAADGYEFFTPFIMMALFKGMLGSIAGPAPNYDMQRILATRNPREAALMSGLVSPVLYVPRYFLVAGITVLALVFFTSELNALGENADFEQILPAVMQRFVPVGLTGLLLAGLFAAFMSTFDATVNAGAAYLVNDIYKRYFGHSEGGRSLTVMSYVGSLTVVAVGIFFGYFMTNLNSVVQWITAGLYGGYVAPNILKWIWWRLNGVGYFAGMMAGVILAMFMADIGWTLSMLSGPWPELATSVEPWTPYLTPLYLFPLLLVASGVASVAASLLTAPDSEEVLKKFYRQVRPWGFWGPVRKKIAAEEPSFQGNTTFRRDMANCAVGIVWQVALSAMPVFLVIREIRSFWISLVVVVVTSVVLKLNWYDNLPRADAE